MESENGYENQSTKISLREPIYVIESPSPDDLYRGRNEGDALAKTLGLAAIEVDYYLVTNSDMFDHAFRDITDSILSRATDQADMPFIHISAHGDDHGLVLTDDDCILWDKLTRSLDELHGRLGPVPYVEEIAKDLPKSSLCLSSCSAFSNYKATLAGHLPLQCMIGPVIDIGWCQSLIGFTTFYYQAFIRENSYFRSVRAMNSAAASLETPAFDILSPHIPAGKF